jgi:hypothetical protein
MRLPRWSRGGPPAIQRPHALAADTRLLGEKAGGSRGDRAVDDLGLRERRQQQHRNADRVRCEPGDESDAVEPRHAHVRDRQRRPHRRDQHVGLFAVGRLAGDPEPARLEQRPHDAGPVERVVVGDEDASLTCRSRAHDHRVGARGGLGHQPIALSPGGPLCRPRMLRTNDGRDAVHR